jgi:NADPH-dependent F420 reductase
MTDRLIITLAILGGTGKEGKALAYRWAKAGYHVIIGSRTPEKAEFTAAELLDRLDSAMIAGSGNLQAAQECDIAVLSVPYSGHGRILEEVREGLKNKILVDVTVPIDPDDPTVFHQPEKGSAAQEAQALLDPSTKVVAAFQNVSHVHLRADRPVPCDVLVCGDSDTAREQVLHLVEAAGLAGWDAGPLAHAAIIEGLSSILLGINKKYGIKHAGFRITGEQR